MTRTTLSLIYVALFVCGPVAARADGVQDFAGIRTDVVSGTCKTLACDATFQTPASDILITRASCNLTTDNLGNQFSGVELGFTNVDKTSFTVGAQIVDFLPPYYFDTSPGAAQIRYQFATDVFYGVKKGSKPNIRIGARYLGTLKYVCTISGPTP